MTRTAFTVLILSVILFTGCSINPVTGKTQLTLMTQPQAVDIGLKYAPELEKELAGPIEDPALQAYVTSVGNKIAAISHKPEMGYHFIAVNDDSVNAMALPDGHIFITKGMLKLMTSEAQLAGVLAHESVHVNAEHTMQAMSKQIGIDLLISAVTGEETSALVVTAAQMAGQITQLKYSRDNEYEADNYGMEYMVKAGYHPKGMLRVMEILENLSKSRSIEFLASHPSPANRLEYLEQKAQSFNTTGLIVGTDAYAKNVLSKLPK